MEADTETLRSPGEVSCLDAGLYNMSVKVRDAFEGGTRLIFTVLGQLPQIP